ncbi:DUF4097 family beta strand repeat protein [Lactobacillus sp. S2-2]|uniref:DUF4097 family beta strand repeat-containing protein n=1 Tax=Lactobacillus sp. S2-2 TaxID=2692917 RepID=UPI001F1E3D43|nr:DUF4097 family beta strand repeat-containing protein [Lactobacillus sp. S2-2]MCF6515323.1 DUF4097 family beta strand repeat protein [Lactobacillus sp. S2-2]
MKKVFKIGLIVFFTGLILGIVGWFAGGGMSTVNKLYISDHLKLNVSNEKRSVNEQISKFDNIKNNADNYALRVVSGDKYSIKVDSNGEKLPKYKVKNGTLTIDKRETDGGRFFVHNDNAPLIIVTVPKSKTLNKVIMNVPNENQMNNFRARNVKINQANIQLNDGNIYLENTILNKKSKLSTLDGDVKIESSSFLNGGTIKTPSDLIYDTGKVKGELNIDNKDIDDDYSDYDDYDDLNKQTIKNVGKVNFDLKASKHGNNYVNGEKRKRDLTINSKQKNSIILNNRYGNNHITTK